MLKSTAIINARLLAELADLRHGDVLVIADAGLPAPEGGRVIDLSLVAGMPSFDVVARQIIETMIVESAVIAEESAGFEPVDRIRADLVCRQVPHAEFKQLVGGARLVVRTGEHTPYANVALVAGVAF